MMKTNLQNIRKLRVMIKNSLFIIVLLSSVQLTFAQEDDENIGTEVINVVKPYTPTVSDAFKIKEIPQVEDEEELEKKEVEYTIFSIPVASTFTPSKGKAAVVEKQAPKRIFNNYASLAIGNYLNVLAELYATIPITNTDNFTVGLNHHSTQGEIKEVQLDDKFYDTGLNLVYGKRNSDISYQIEGMFKHQEYNWYGTSYALTDLQRTNIDASHTFFTAGLGANVEVENSFFKGGNIGYKRFWDTYDASENRVLLNPKFEFDVADFPIHLNATLDYVGGEFGTINPTYKYSYLNTGIHPSYQYLQDDLAVNIGLELMFSLASEQGETEFHVFPKINASYNLVDDTVIAFGGLQGALQQNSYEQFAQQNKYVAPLLGIAPTDNQYDIYLGLRGKLSNKVNYSIKGQYLNEQDKAMFIMNPVNDVDLVTENYDKANTFGVLYDNVNTFRFSAMLSADFSKNYTVGLQGSYASYDTENLEEVYNLPQLKASLFGDFVFSEKWYGGLNFFYIGERKDRLQSTTVLITPSEVTLKGYFDANAHVGYIVTDRFTAFLKANNIANQDYQVWQSYPVQGIQILGGLTYKFDF